MANIKRANTSGITKTGTAIPDVPDAPTIGAASDVGTSRAYNNGSATVAYTAAPTGGAVTTFTATSTPGGFTATGSSPITVTGLASGTAYTFTVKGTNASATGPDSSASSSVTATTVPQAPTIGTATDQGSGRAYNNGQASVSFTPGATGGKTVTGYTVTSSPGSLTGTGASSPITVTGLSSATAYTYSVTATNANGTSTASSASGSVTATTVPQAPTIGTFTDGGTGTTGTLSFTAGATGGSSITNYKVSTDNVTFTALSPAQTSSPLSLSGLSVGTATYYIKAVNTNGDSAASSGVSGTVIQPSNFESIATFTPSSGNTVTFSSIPQTYKVLHLRINEYLSGNGFTTIRINGLSSATYVRHTLGTINGSTVTTYGAAPSGSSDDAFYLGRQLTNISPYSSVAIVDFIDYASTTKYKTMRSIYGTNSNGTSYQEVELTSGVNYANTNAITSITVFTNQTFDAGTSFALYGIK